MSKKQMTVRDVIFQAEFDDVLHSLQNYDDRPQTTLPSEFWSTLSLKKRGYVQDNHQLRAKASWCLETIGRIQDYFVTIFLHIGSDEYQEAWGLLEKCDKAIRSLDKHFTESEDEFGIEHIRTHAQQLQELYELTWGLSPGFLHKEVRCSVCNTVLALRSGCEHEIGGIYDGEMCHGIVSELEFLHVALVDSPAQKYSVIWPDIEGSTRFATVKYVSEKLISPWHRWSYHKEVRRKFTLHIRTSNWMTFVRVGQIWSSSIAV